MSKLGTETFWSGSVSLLVSVEVLGQGHHARVVEVVPVWAAACSHVVEGDAQFKYVSVERVCLVQKLFRSTIHRGKQTFLGVAVFSE